MSSNRRITPTSGKSAYIDSGELNSYQDIATKRTQQDAINEGKEFKRSVYKTPWGANADYQGMEFIASPRSFQPIDILLNINPEGIPDNFDLPTTEEEEDKLPCDCPDCQSVSAIPSEVCCEGVSSVPIGFFVIGKLRGNIGVSGAGFNDYIQHEYSNPLLLDPNCGKKSVQCFTNQYTAHFDCSGSWTERQSVLTLCGKSQNITIRKECGGGGCSSLAIEDISGGAADDTILTTGTNSYRTTGCSGAITWSVAAASGSSLGSAAITSAGVLTATGACGTLVVTATCTGCGTSATQDVRVTNSGQWDNIYSCADGGEECYIACGCQATDLVTITGRYQYTDRFYLGRIETYVDNGCSVYHGRPACCNSGSPCDPTWTIPTKAGFKYEWKGTGGCA